MRVLYSSFIQLLALGFKLAALFGNPKAKQWVNGRRQLFKRLSTEIPGDKDVIWFHCASLGEFEQSRSLLERIAQENRHFILLTFFSPSGYESKKDYKYADLVSYMPLDSRANARKFIEIIDPSISFFAKYEFWFNHLYELRKRELKHYLISGIFRPKQQFFRFYGKWFREHLRAFTHLFLQDQASVDLLRSFGISNCSLSGDGRFDRVWEIAQEAAAISEVEKFVDKKKCVVFGSSWEKEDQLAFQLAERDPELKIILAPHEFHAEALRKLEQDHPGVKVNYYSTLKKDSYKSQILVIDRMGLLSRIYRYGDVAVVGGGFGKGIHNILEAAVYGLPVMFGPNYHFFNEARELISEGAAKVFKNEAQFHQQIDQYIHTDKERERVAWICKAYFKEKVGASSLIFNQLKERKVL
jgi:3-deoxy-D-manno-octulosonic-acid transferase